MKIVGMSKPSKVPQVDPTFMSDPMIPQTMKDELYDNTKSPYIKLIRHFPYHNADHTILIDDEFGRELSEEFAYYNPSDCDSDFRDMIDTLPELTQMVYITGKGFTREVAICSTVSKANEIKDKILALDKIEEITSEKRLYVSTIKKVVN